MSTRGLAILAILVMPLLNDSLSGAPGPEGAAALVAQKAPGFVTPRTPWGDPDLNGVWPSIDMVRVPMQRPPSYRGRLFMTAQGAHRAREAGAGTDRPDGEGRRRRCDRCARTLGGVG